MRVLSIRRNLFCTAWFGLALAVVFCAFSVTAADASRERVVAVEGTELRLAHSGKAVFADVMFPEPARAETWLSQHLLQQEISFTPRDDDRYGRLRIATDAEAQMLREGVALAYSAEPLAPELLAAEAQARAAKRGLWASDALFATPETAPQHLQQFMVIEGAITNIYHARDASYLNFGMDWHSDFSVKIPRKYRRSFSMLDNLKEGARVRVRGMIIPQEGTMIVVSRPEQLEKL